jgi:hypothetical protein
MGDNGFDIYVIAVRMLIHEPRIYPIQIHQLYSCGKYTHAGTSIRGNGQASQRDAIPPKFPRKLHGRDAVFRRCLAAIAATWRGAVVLSNTTPMESVQEQL